MGRAPPPSRWPRAALRAAARDWTFSADRDKGGARPTEVDYSAAVGETVPGLWAWLRHMKLEHHWEAVDAWCRQAGLTTMQDVVKPDRVAALLDALPFEDPEASTLRRRARTALAAVNGFQ